MDNLYAMTRIKAIRYISLAVLVFVFFALLLFSLIIIGY